MQKNTRLLLFLICWAVFLVAKAQNPKYITGVVLEVDEAGNFSPLVGAGIVYLATSQGTATDANGVFKIPFLEGNKYLVVSYVGHKTDTIFLADRYTDVRVVLKSKTEMKNIEVLEKRASTYVSKISTLNVQTLTERELFKAACCNLSESFETNPSIDVSYADAVTGVKTISLLGLSGVYTSLTEEAIPSTRGISASSGLGYTPGTWIESIQITKGVGSVVNGFEGGVGQINVELWKPETADLFYLNGYVNSMGRVETNLNTSLVLNSKWATSVMLHYDFLNLKSDDNEDNFTDLPIGYQYNLFNRWKYADNKGLSAQFSFRVLRDEREGGPVGAINFIPYIFKNTNQRLEGTGKIGYVFPKKLYKSLGLQVKALQHEQNFQTRFVDYPSYAASQTSLYANFIYQTIISDSRHKIRMGGSFLQDNIRERMPFRTVGLLNPSRLEQTSGAFGEYTWDPSAQFTLIAGLRADYSNLFGAFVTPRLHLRYAIDENTTLRVSGGRGQRSASVIAENLNLIANSRNTVYATLDTNGKLRNYGLRPEVSWNYGFSIIRDFEVFYRNASLTLDFYRTDFQEQVISDLYSNEKLVYIGNLPTGGRSFANAAQLELSYSPIRRLEVRAAYKYYDVRTATYFRGLLARPFISPHRAFMNLAYETRNKKWNFDLTFQFWGRRPLPQVTLADGESRTASESPNYLVINAQVSRVVSKTFEAYVGVENLTGFVQPTAIYFTQGEWPNFDASLLWGPVFGPMVYAGFRFRIKKDNGETGKKM